MKSKEELNPFLLYLSRFLIGVLLNILLLILICSLPIFDGKSAALVLVYGGAYYFFKSILFFLPYLLFYKISLIKHKISRIVISLLPFVFFSVWFFTIKMFKIEEFYDDIRVGYFVYFSHFKIQLLVCLSMCVWTLKRLTKFT
jgi:hypothetical protein